MKNIERQSDTFNTAVLFLVFNRQETAKNVFNAIRKAKPARLYIAADGPRENKDGEHESVQSVRDYVMNNIDWECEVKTLFRDENLGCKHAISGAITWFFDNEEQGIILEDDCLPSPGFFTFCEELLIRYKDDLRVGQISGFNYGYKNKNLNYDYFFSRYPMIWGWATWRNRWNKYTLELDGYEEIKKNKQLSLLFNRFELRRRMKRFEGVRNGSIDSWAYQWSFTLYKNNQLTIIPKNNFILNIGFGEDSTHTKGYNPYKDMTLDEVADIENHPEYFIQLKSLYSLINSRDNLLHNIIKMVRRI